MFKLAINEAGTTKCFHNENGDTVKVEPLGVFDFSRARMPGGFRPIGNFLAEMKRLGKSRFYIQRTYALGDMLTGVPVVRWLRSQGWDAFLRITGAYTPVADMLSVPYAATHVSLNESAPGIIVDWLLERDHTDIELGKLNRVHIYMKALGVDIPTEALDWSTDPERFPVPALKLPERYVVMSGWGANARKRLPEATIERVLVKLNEAGVRVLYNGGPPSLKAPTDKTWQLGRQLSVGELFYVIHRADALITVDSGPLWIGHLTATPTIAVLGPSHWRQRCLLHPLWPEGVVAIQMDEWAGCTTCTENGRACEATYRCLHESGDRLADEILANTLRFQES